ncbi:MAG: ATP-binding protein [Polyangiaceae bacterium]
MELGIRAEADSPLSTRLSMLMGLRLLMLSIFLGVTAIFYSGGLPAGGFSSRVALVALVAAFATALVFALLLRRGRGLQRVALAQLVTDQITWTAFVYITGGVTSGGTSLYGLTCLSGAILLGTPGAIVAAVSGIGAYGILCAGFVAGLLPRPTDQPIEAYATRWADVRYPLFVNLLGLALVTFLAGYLAERLRTTGGRLAQATARAEEAERLAALGRIAAALAHEIRNPLGSIAGSIELLRTGGTLSPQDQELCGIVTRETARLNDLINDMLDLTRPRVPARSRFDLASVARDVVSLASQSGRGSDVAVRYEGPDVAEVEADPAQMRQVVWNLVRNAIQASPAGDEVRIRLDVEPQRALLSISDHGPGIPAEARERLFDAFFTTRSHGVGIGLAVVKRILDDHGFAIEVDSVPDRGTTFRVLIPLSGRRSMMPKRLSGSAPPADPAGES